MLNSGVSLQRLATKAGVGFTPKKLFSNGEAGVWYDPSDAEASLTWRRNLLEYTESFDSSVYDNGANTTITANHATYIDGSGADRVQMPASAGTYVMQSVSLTQGKTYTVSAFVKTNGGPNINIGFGTGVSNGVNFGANESATSSWTRVSSTYTAASTATYWAGIDNQANSNAVDIHLFGLQVEEGSTATEYQPIRSTFDNAFKQAFPKHTLYQDSKGIYPVSGLGQSVGLMLDKSQGVAFGDEEATNGDFSNGTTGWSSASSGVGNVVNGQLVITSNNPTDDAYAMSQSFTVVQGESYKVSANLVSTTGSSIQCRAGSTNTSASYGTLDSNNSFGNVSMIVVPTTSTMWITLYGFGAGDSGTFDNISVVKVKGSHATQSDSTKRPVFARHPERGRVNLFKYTEEFDNGFWNKYAVTLTTNATTAPDGTNTASRIVATASNNTHQVQFTNNYGTDTFTQSIYAKAGEYSYLVINGLQSGDFTYFNLSNGTIGNITGAHSNVTMTDVGNGWYRCSVTHAGNNNGAGFGGAENNGAHIFTGDGSSGIYIWGAQLEKANEATGYQKVVDDYDITESGYKSVYYLQFDGINDTMAVQPVTSTNAPISVFMGHDTEGNTSTSGYFFDIEDGRFLLAGAGYYSTASSWQNGTNIDATAKGVSTVVSDGTNANYRRDGIVEHTGALANVPIQGAISIFSRLDYTTQHTNGNMYQLVIRGATSTDKEIDQAEEFVAIKTGLKSEVVGLATLDLNFGANIYTARNSNGSVL